MNFTFPLSGDAVATLTVSKEIDVEDVDTLVDYLETAKKALLKAARRRAAEMAASAAPPQLEPTTPHPLRLEKAQ